MTYNLNEEQTYSFKNLTEIFNIEMLDWSMGKNVLLEHLRFLKILQEGAMQNIPYKCFVDRGFFNPKSCIKQDEPHPILDITEKGLNWLINEKKAIIELNEREYWKEKYPKEYAKLLEAEKRYSE
jgi:hypothetical protein